MYIKDGIAYSGNLQAQIKVKSVRALDNDTTMGTRDESGSNFYEEGKIHAVFRFGIEEDGEIDGYRY